MKKNTWLLFLLLFTLKSYSQEKEFVGKVVYHKAFVGISGGYVFQNYDPLNAKISGLKIPAFDNGKFLIGATGSVMLSDNFRVGGIVLTGSQQRFGQRYNAKADYKFGGLTFEYTWQFISKATLSLGGIIGGGYQSVEFYSNANGNMWDSFLWWSDIYSDVMLRMENDFFIITPTVNLDVPVSRLFSFRIGGGYIINPAKWTLNNGKQFAYVPGELASNNFFIQTGIFFGFFAF